MGCLAAGPVPASAAPLSGWATLAGAAPPSPEAFGARLTGPAPPSTPVSLQVYFRPSSWGQLVEQAAAVSTPGGPAYHHYLSVGEFAALFGPSPGQVEAVDQYLASKGLEVSALEPNHLAQGVTGTVSQAEAALRSPFWQLRTRRGAVVVGSTAAPELPVALAGSVAYVGGLDPWVEQANDLARLPPPGGGGKAPASWATVHASAAPRAATSEAGPAAADSSPACQQEAAAGLSPAQLAAAYGLSGFYAKGDQGQGQTIGLIEYAQADTAAIEAFEACTGASLTLYYDPTSSPPSSVDPEVAADVEVVAALAPRATVEVYESAQTSTGLEPWELAVSGGAPGGLPSVISSSWGSCEPNTGLGSAYYDEEQAIFDEAALQGQTVLVASGDNGSEGCLAETGSKALAVVDPASSPEVTAVGGTGSDTPTGPQYVWNSHGAPASACLGTGCGSGASGGGASVVWPRPAYQPPPLVAPASCDGGPTGCREVPDVSALAGDPYAQYCSPSVCGGDGWLSFGGTSLAAPSWGATVLLSESLCPARVGFLNPLLYREPQELTSPVTSGNNDLTGTNAGQYRADPSGGYSMATGLGYLGQADLSNGALCGPPPGSPATPGAAGPGGTSLGALVPTPPAHACAKAQDQAARGQPQALAATQDANGCGGYWVVTQAGEVAAFGSAPELASLATAQPHAPIVGIAAAPDGKGYWLLGADGGVFAFGDARFYGSPVSSHLRSAAVGLAPTPDGRGYWVAAANGAVFAFGDARFYGSARRLRLQGPIAGIAATPSGKGYWLAATDGGVFAFGDAAFRGSAHPAKRAPAAPVVGISSSSGGSGYRLATANGAVYDFGAHYYGDLGTKPARARLVSIAPSPDERGYYLVDADGDVFAFGDAVYLGSVTGG